MEGPKYSQDKTKDSQVKYDDVARKLDAHFTPQKNLSWERYSFKIYKEKPDVDCSVYITRFKRMAETCEYENLNTEIKDQFIMSCKSERMREKLLLEQDLTLTKLVDICRNIRNQSNFKPKNWMTEIKKMFHQIENLQKIWKAKPG